MSATSAFSADSRKARSKGRTGHNQKMPADASNLAKEEKKLTLRLTSTFESPVSSEPMDRPHNHNGKRARLKTALIAGNSDKLLESYKNKLALFVVEELTYAVGLRDSEGSQYDSDSDVGLSIDGMHDEQKCPEFSSSFSCADQLGIGLNIDQDMKIDHLAVEEPDFEADGQDFRQTKEKIRSLFYQVTSKVPPHIVKQLHLSSTDGSSTQIYFYELLSSHFGSESMQPFVKNTLLVKLAKLYSIDETFPALFALLMYKFILKHDVDDYQDEASKARFSIMMKGLTQLFKHEVNQKSRRLFPLYSYLRASINQKKTSENSESWNQLKGLLLRHYFYYSSSKTDAVLLLLKEMDVSMLGFILENLSFILSKLAVQENDEAQPRTEVNTVAEIEVSVHYLATLTKLVATAELNDGQWKNNSEIQKFMHRILASPIAKSNIQVKSSAIKCLNSFFPGRRGVLSSIMHMEIVQSKIQLVESYLPSAISSRFLGLFLQK